jgi:hypothetical protein
MDMMGVVSNRRLGRDSLLLVVGAGNRTYNGECGVMGERQKGRTEGNQKDPQKTESWKRRRKD